MEEFAGASTSLIDEQFLLPPDPMADLDASEIAEAVTAAATQSATQAAAAARVQAAARGSSARRRAREARQLMDGSLDLYASSTDGSRSRGTPLPSRGGTSLHSRGVTPGGTPGG